MLIATHGSDAANCVIVALNSDFESFHILLECQLLNVLHSCSLSPILSIYRADANVGKISFNDRVKL